VRGGDRFVMSILGSIFLMMFCLAVCGDVGAVCLDGLAYLYYTYLCYFYLVEFCVVVYCCLAVGCVAVV